MRNAIFSKSQLQDAEEKFQAGEPEVPVQAGSREEPQSSPSESENIVESGSPTDGPPLIAAVREGNLKEVERLVDENASLEDVDSDGATPLLVAAKKGHADIFRYLLDRGADLDARDHTGLGTLQWATANAHPEIVDIILGPSNRKEDDTGQQPTESGPPPTSTGPTSEATAAEKRTNGYALAGLILGLLSIFTYPVAFGAVPLLGTILSVIGLVKADSYKGRGRIQGVVGLIISLVYFMYFLLRFFIAVAAVNG